MVLYLDDIYNHSLLVPTELREPPMAKPVHRSQSLYHAIPMSQSISWSNNLCDSSRFTGPLSANKMQLNGVGKKAKESPSFSTTGEKTATSNWLVNAIQVGKQHLMRKARQKRSRSVGASNHVDLKVSSTMETLNNSDCLRNNKINNRTIMGPPKRSATIVMEGSNGLANARERLAIQSYQQSVDASLLRLTERV